MGLPRAGYCCTQSAHQPSPSVAATDVLRRLRAVPKMPVLGSRLSFSGMFALLCTLALLSGAVAVRLPAWLTSTPGPASGLRATATYRSRSTLLLARAQQNFSLPPLPYATDALVPVIDNQTMYNHHSIHHQTYITNLNNALANLNGSSIRANTTLTELVAAVGTGRLGVPRALETTIRNNGGGAWNHALFWRIMAPPNSSDTTQPSNSSRLYQAVVRDFGSWNAMISAVNAAGAARFGSGWTWLVYRRGHLSVVDLANQDNPLSGQNPQVPVLAIDVWEHAYYLNYGPRRAAYLSSWWRVANWTRIQENYEIAHSNGDAGALIGAADRRA